MKKMLRYMLSGRGTNLCKGKLLLVEADSGARYISNTANFI